MRLDRLEDIILKQIGDLGKMASRHGSGTVRDMLPPRGRRMAANAELKNKGT